MRRSAAGPRRRRPPWRVGAAVPAPAPADRTARLVTDTEARLADGVVVEADVTARLLGVRVLRLEASVVLLPASVQSQSPVAEGLVLGARQVGLEHARHLIEDSDRLLSRAQSVSR